MGWRPKLNVVCGRCGKPTGLRHVCVSNSRKPMTTKLKVSFGKCPKCKKVYGANPALHVCTPRSDFKKRKKTFEQEQARREREKARKARPKHDYTECSDEACKRSLCVAFKGGQELGDAQGHARGWQQGYDRGFPDGQDACPRKHE
jgi:Zn-finger nucleic acid-binding protein